MREVLEAAERLAREERKNRRRREEHTDEDTEATQTSSSVDSNTTTSANDKSEQNHPQTRVMNSTSEDEKSGDPKDTKETEKHSYENDKVKDDNREQKPKDGHADKSEEVALDPRSLQVPVSKDVAIVLSGRLDDPDILSRANLQLVNLVMTPSPHRFDNAAKNLSLGLSAIMKNNATMTLSPRNLRRCSSRADSASIVVQNRLLTPSKYRTPLGRDCGTQTDVESDLQELRDKLQDSSIREHHGGTTKDRKDTTNANRRNVEK